MIRLTYKILREGEFLTAFEKLMVQPNLPQTTAYRLGKIAQKVRPIASEAQNEFMKLVLQFCILDENGKISEMDGPGTFRIAPEKVEDWKKGLETFGKTEVLIDRLQFGMDQFMSATLTPNDYLALEPLINELSLVEDKTPVGSVGQAGA